MELIMQWAAALIGVAMISALAESFLSSRSMKQILRLITAVAMITLLFTPLLNLDLSAYSAAMRRERVSQIWDADSAAENERMLNRMLIESECSTYILDKGAALDIPVQEATVTLRWDTEGYWVPERAQIVLAHETNQTDILRDVITTDLGIAAEAQEWSIADEN